MATTSGEAATKTFEALEINYEHAYGKNPLKKACIDQAINLLPHSNDGKEKVLDVGCGTGKPVSEMLANAGFQVTGLDISPKMIGHAKSRITGTFELADCLEYQPKDQYAGVFLIFSFLQLKAWREFYDLIVKYANAVQSDGLLVLGTVPADNLVAKKEDYDPTGTYVVDYPAPFMGQLDPHFLVTSQGLVDLVTSMGFRILSNEIGVFQPDDPRCVPEDQQYIIAQRIGGAALSKLRPEP